MFDLSSHKTPTLITHIFPNLIWKVDTAEKEVFLTFDDGPIPHLTEDILNILSNFNIKATFFCVGENVKRYPEIFKKVLTEGHKTANHTHNHLKAWKVNQSVYLDNIIQAQDTMESIYPGQPKIFRPPYGQITPWLNKKIKELGFKIVMWDILTKDYLQNLDINQAFNKCISKTVAGSVIVFHDNLKAKNNIVHLLPMYINSLKSAGYKFNTL